MRKVEVFTSGMNEWNPTLNAVVGYGVPHKTIRGYAVVDNTKYIWATHEEHVEAFYDLSGKDSLFGGPHSLICSFARGEYGEYLIAQIQRTDNDLHIIKPNGDWAANFNYRAGYNSGMLVVDGKLFLRDSAPGGMVSLTSESGKQYKDIMTYQRCIKWFNTIAELNLGIEFLDTLSSIANFIDSRGKMVTAKEWDGAKTLEWEINQSFFKVINQIHTRLAGDHEAEARELKGAFAALRKMLPNYHNVMEYMREAA